MAQTRTRRWLPDLAEPGGELLEETAQGGAVDERNPAHDPLKPGPDPVLSPGEEEEQKSDATARPRPPRQPSGTAEKPHNGIDMMSANHSRKLRTTAGADPLHGERETDVATRETGLRHQAVAQSRTGG